MQVASAQFVERPPRRKVWVLNRHPTKSYSEEYRSVTYTIPPAGQKDPSNLMDLLTAEKFLAAGTVPQENDLAGRELTMGKPLYWEDLTPEELLKYDPKMAAEMGLIAKQQEEDVENLCTICGEKLPTVKGLQLHTTRMHPGFEPVTKR